MYNLVKPSPMKLIVKQRDILRSGITFKEYKFQEEDLTETFQYRYSEWTNADDQKVSEELFKRWVGTKVKLAQRAADLEAETFSVEFNPWEDEPEENIPEEPIVPPEPDPIPEEPAPEDPIVPEEPPVDPPLDPVPEEPILDPVDPIPDPPVEDPLPEEPLNP